MRLPQMNLRGAIAGVAAATLLMISHSALASPPTSVDASAIEAMVIEAAERNGVVPAGLALAVARVESNFSADAESTAGARGVMQIMPATARDEFALDPDRLWDPYTNINTGVEYLSQLYLSYGRDWNLALSHYNGGALKRVDGRYVVHGYTRDYIADVIHYWQIYETAEAPVVAQVGDLTPPSRGYSGQAPQTTGAGDRQGAGSGRFRLGPCRGCLLGHEALSGNSRRFELPKGPAMQEPIVQDVPTYYGKTRFRLDPPRTGGQTDRFGWTGNTEVPLTGNDRFQ